MKYEHPARFALGRRKISRGCVRRPTAWAIYVAEVSVDLATAEIHVDDFVHTRAGSGKKLINPILAAGQIEGGVAQGIGLALYENVVWQEGRMVNGQMTNYIMPTSMDVPPIRVFFEEIPYGRGPAWPAKGIRRASLWTWNRTRDCKCNCPRATGADIRRIPGHARSAAGDAGKRSCVILAGAVRVHCRVNGRAVTLEAYPMARLLDVLREQLCLTGVKEGCGEGECGACSVMIDGALVNSCLVPVLQAEGTEILTIEGVAGEHLHAVQQAFLEYGGAQCGICTPGMIPLRL